jgi:small subunit ribosomal protein S2
MVKDVALVRKLLDAGVHFGHQTKRWNPKMKRYIFGSRSGIYIIDLEKTETQLERARKFLEELGAANQVVLFVGTKKQARAVIQAEAIRCGQPYVINRWLGGTLTNFNTIKQNISRFLDLKRRKEAGEFELLTKKDARRNERYLAKLDISVGNISTLTGLPACMFVIDPKREANAVHEANRLKIPVVAICDTNADPDLIAHPVPGNDDAIRSIKLITGMLTDAIVAGRRRAGLPMPGETPAADAADAAAIPAPQTVAQPA